MTGASIEATYSYSRYASNQTVSKRTGQPSFSEKTDEKGTEAVKKESQRGTVMAEYYSRKPQYKEKQVDRVNLGYSVLSSAGLSAEDMENMSMSEFKDIISRTIAGIPHHGTRPYDEETVLITEEGWENMKKDPDYAAWVVGVIKEDRSVSNPFFGMGDKGAFIVQTFGASPSDYKGQSFSKIYGGTAAGARSAYNAATAGGGIVTRGPQADLQPPADYNLWEEKRKARQKKRKELIEADIQAKYMQKKRLNEMYENKYYQNKALESSRNTARFFDTRNNTPSVMKSPASIAASYEAAFMTADIAEMF